MDFRREPLSDLAEQVRSGKVAAREVVGHALNQIDRLNGDLNAFVAASGEDPGPLAGVPIGVKDLEDAAGFRTSHGSHGWADAAPAVTNSPLVDRLVSAGCVVVGKTNTPELGWKADTENLLFGPTWNPWDRTRSPGGSSGGSATAI